MTAEEFLRIKGCNSYVHNGETYFSDVTIDDLVEFAKYHVEQALLKASEEAYVEVLDYNDYEVNKKSILESYPLENIK